jgi:hypothetical protein
VSGVAAGAVGSSFFGTVDLPATVAGAAPPAGQAVLQAGFARDALVSFRISE